MALVGNALAGIRVLDLTVGRAGPLATMLLADFGADVVRVEVPDGDPSRLDVGSTVWNRGKRSVGGDARTVGSLVRGADIVATSELDGWYEVDPTAVVLRTPPTLPPCPWAGGRESDALISAWMGIALRQASFDGGPIDSIYPIVTTIQGIWAAACAVAALVERERSGHGQVVTVTGEHGAMIANAGGLTFKHADLAEPAQRRRGGPGGSVPFYRTYRCGDGEWLFFGALTPRFTRIGFEVLGLTELFDDPRLEGRGRAAMLQPEHAPWVTEAIAGRFLTAARDEWLARLRTAGCPAGAVLDRDGWLDHPQIDAIEMRVRVEDPARGTFEMPGVPVRLERTPGRVHSTGASDGQTWDARPSPVDAGTAPAGPLDGIRVLDLGAIIAGPFAASLLGELGADVLKVEPLTGDSFRGPGFAAYNKGQRGIALDLRHEDGSAAFLELVRTADIVVDNYRPGVLQRLGITWDELQTVNPRVISASITGFGDGGPFGADAGFDPVLQAMSGMMRAQGGDSDPVFFTVPVNDVAGAATLAFGSVLALFHRERTGESQRVSTSLAAMSALLQAEALVRFEGRPPARRGSRDHLGSSALDRFYQAADGWFRIETDPEAMSSIVADPSEEAIAAWASTQSRDDILTRLFEAGIAAAPARTIAEIASDPHMYANDVLHPDPRTDREGSTAGRHAAFSRTMRSDTLVSPSLGQHAREILAEIGYADARIDALIEERA